MADLQEIMGRVIRRERQDRRLTIKELGGKAQNRPNKKREVECILPPSPRRAALAEQAETPTGTTSVGATSIVVPRIVGTNAMIGKSAPDEYQNSGYQNRANQWYTIEYWLANDAKMENADDQQNCQKAQNDSTEQTIGSAATCQQFPNKANEDRDQ